VKPEHAFVVEPIIGLEVHIQLATRTKMWCGCAVEFGRPPNTRVCPVCLGLPGALPVMNRQAVELAVLTGLALNCEIAPVSKWDRKNYFYPDLPKNYQISQYDRPLCFNGYVELKSDHKIHKIRVRRAHLEEDAGKNIHDFAECTAVDLNRAGTPLLEVVTEPDFRSADEVHEFAVQLQRVVRYLGVSEANMQKGQMRFEPNVNLKITKDTREFRTPIVEVKNLNSFRSLHGAISFELSRQLEEWRKTGEVAQPGNKRNRGWDELREVTTPQREKEEAHDYRYFPDPDLVPLTTDPRWVAELREHLPEMPIPRTERFISEYTLPPQDAAALVDCRATADLLDQAVEVGGDKSTLARQFLSFWSRHAHDRHTTIAGLGVGPGPMAALANLVREGQVNATAAARIASVIVERVDQLLQAREQTDGTATQPSIEALHATSALKRPAPDKCITYFEPVDAPGLSPARLAEELGLLQSSDEDEIAAWVSRVLAAHQQAVRDALAEPKKATAARGFLTGQVMQLSGGKADPQIVAELIERELREIADAR
jgi:aspartyl-tRNA(Asn)/glutamyl-tRNA(Gln) amidotransferase subunit B